MLEREPSRTAFAAAAYRAVHQVSEGAFFFKDPYAVPILGVDPEALKADPAAGDDRRGIRFFVVARSVIAEGALKRGVEERGVGQLVVLGAGLDTFAYRNPFGDRLRVFEVDHPATQAWKRNRLAEAGIAIPDSLTYAPVDFEREDLTAQLAAAGLQADVRTVFTWLGVVPYLTRDAIAATLAQIAAHPGRGRGGVRLQRAARGHRPRAQGPLRGTGGAGGGHRRALPQLLRARRVARAAARPWLRRDRRPRHPRHRRPPHRPASPTTEPPHRRPRAVRGDGLAGLLNARPAHLAVLSLAQVKKGEAAAHDDGLLGNGVQSRADLIAQFDISGTVRRENGMTIQGHCAFVELIFPSQEKVLLLTRQGEQSAIDFSKPIEIGPIIGGFVKLAMKDVGPTSKVGDAGVRNVKKIPKQVQAVSRHRSILRWIDPRLSAR
jgi:methyltransferase (TIGR00027 family)